LKVELFFVFFWQLNLLLLINIVGRSEN